MAWLADSMKRGINHLRRQKDGPFCPSHSQSFQFHVSAVFPVVCGFSDADVFTVISVESVFDVTVVSVYAYTCSTRDRVHPLSTLSLA